MGINDLCLQSIKNARESFYEDEETEWPYFTKSVELIKDLKQPFEERFDAAVLLISLPHSKLSMAFEAFQQFQGLFELVIYQKFA